MTVRGRVTATFCAVLLLVLAATGGFVYLRMRASLDESVGNGLRTSAGQVRALVQGGGSLAASVGIIEPDETFAQVLAPDGRVLDSTPRQRARAVVPPGATGERTLPAVPGLEADTRVLAVRAGERTIVVGASLGDRDEALGRLLRLLLIGGAAGLLVVSAAGAWAIGRALAPVEAMRRRASEVTGAERLPVPAPDDELRRLGLTLNAMLDRLQDGVERERRFADDASHELRTPLTTLRTELDLALRQAGSEAELRAALVAASGDVDRLIALAEGLLVVARAGEAAAADDIDVRTLLEAAAAGRDVTIDAPDGLRLHGDRALLERAVVNLLENAERHGAPPITLGAAPGRLWVADHGPGFDAAFLPRAFERFARADASRTTGGFGLGLAIVDAIARAHGGRATARNRRAGGAEVAFTVVSRDEGQAVAHDQQDQDHSRHLHRAGAGRWR